MTQPELTPELIGAAGMDAASRAMRKAGRTKWSAEDYNIGAKEANRLWAIYDRQQEERNAKATQAHR